MFGFDSTFTTNDDRTLTAFLLGENFDGTINLGHDGRIFRFTSLKNLGNTRQTTGDIRNT